LGSLPSSPTTRTMGVTKVTPVIGVDYTRDPGLFVGPKGFCNRPVRVIGKFCPLDLPDPKRVGKMIRIPHFKPSEERKFIFNFPIVDYFGVFKPHVFARVSMTHEKFILSLAETCFYRLKRCNQFRHVSSHTLYECAMYYAMTRDDYAFDRFRQLARYQPAKLSKYVYHLVLNKLPASKQVYMSVCLTALNRRSRSHLSDFGGKGQQFYKSLSRLVSFKNDTYRRGQFAVLRKETLNLFGASIAPRHKRFPNPF